MQQLLKVPQLTCATLKLLQLAVAEGHDRADKDDDDADEDEVAKQLTGSKRRRMSSKAKPTLDLTTCSIEINLLKILMSIFAACNILLQVPYVHTVASRCVA